MTPDGDLLATAGESGNAQVWRIQDDAPVALFTSALPEPPRGLFFDEAVAGFSASGEVVAITAIYAYYHNFTFIPQEASVQVWNTGSRTLMGETSFSIFPSPGVWSPEASVALHPAGNALAYLSAPGLVEIISVPEGRVIGSASTGATCGGDFVLSPGGQLLATYTGNFIVLCRTSDGSIVRRIRVPTGEITDIAFSPDGSMLASSGFTFSYLEASHATYDPNVHVWDVESGSLLRTFSEHRGNVMAVAFSGDGELLAAGGGVRPHMQCADRVADPRILVWSVAEGQRLWTLDGVPGGTGHLAFSPSGRVLAVTSNACCRWTAPNGLWTYELSDGFRIHRLVSEGCAPLLEPVFSPDGSILAEDSSSLAGSELFDTETMERVGSLPVNAAAFSPSGDLVASPQYPSGIVLVTTDGSGIAARSGSLADFRLIFSPDGSRIYSAPEAAPGVVAVWGVPSQP
jgi:WD40 repeat protein